MRTAIRQNSLILGGMVLLALAGWLLTAHAASATDHGGGHTPVTICHHAGPHPENWHTITVDDDSVMLTAHLAHGDTLGPCIDTPTPTPTASATPTAPPSWAPTPTPTPTVTPSVEPSVTPTITPTPSAPESLPPARTPPPTDTDATVASMAPSLSLGLVLGAVIGAVVGVLVFSRTRHQKPRAKPPIGFRQR